MAIWPFRAKRVENEVTSDHVREHFCVRPSDMLLRAFSCKKHVLLGNFATSRYRDPVLSNVSIGKE